MNSTLSGKYVHVFCWKSSMLFSSKRFLDGNAYLWHNRNRKLSMFRGNKNHFIVLRDSFFENWELCFREKKCVKILLIKMILKSHLPYLEMSPRFEASQF